MDTCKLWGQKVAEDVDLWFDGNLKAFPLILQHEYQRLRNMFRDGEYVGTFYELKDILELTVKLPIIYVVADLFQHRRDGFEDSLKLLLGGPLSLGTWIQIADKLAKTIDFSEDYKALLIEISTRYKCSNSKKQQFDITNWRNIRIGHGAYSIYLQEDHKEEIEQLLKVLKAFLENTYNIFSKFTWIYESEKRRKKVKSLSDLHDVTKVKIKYGKKFILLSPFIEIIDGSLYLFDFYLFNKKLNIGYLDYYNNHKIKKAEILLKAFYDEIVSKAINDLRRKPSRIRDISDERTVIAKIFNKNLIKPVYLKDIVVNWLNTYDKGIFLMEAEAGLGKTTFVKLLDPLLKTDSQNNYMPLVDSTVRAFYFRQGDTLSSTGFKEELRSSLLQYDSGQTFSVDDKIPEIIDSNTFIDFLSFFQELYSEAERFEYRNKLVIILDGIDESVDNQFDFSSFLLSDSLIRKNIYIIVTSRITTNPNSIMLQLINNMDFTDKVSIFANDDRNKDLVNTYTSQFTPSCRLANNINTLLEADLLQYIPEIIDESELITYKMLFEYYCKKLEYIYGSKYFRPLKNTLLVLALSDIPVSFNDLVKLADLGEDRYYIQSLFMDIKPFITKFTYNNVTGYTLAHQELKTLVLTTWATDIDLLAINLMKSLASKVYEGEPLIGADLIAAYIAFKHITTNLIDFWNCYIREDRVLIPILKQLVIQDYIEAFNVYGDKINYLLLRLSDHLNNALTIPKTTININKYFADTVNVKISYDSNILIKLLGYINRKLLFDDMDFQELSDSLIKEAKKYKVSSEVIELINNFSQDCNSINKIDSSNSAVYNKNFTLKYDNLDGFSFIKYLPISHHSLFLGQRECVLSLLDSLIKYLEENTIEEIRSDVIDYTLAWIHDITSYNNLDYDESNRTYNGFIAGLFDFFNIPELLRSRILRCSGERYPNSLLSAYEREFVLANLRLYKVSGKEGDFSELEFNTKNNEYHNKKFTLLNVNKLVIQLKLYYHLLKSENLISSFVELNYNSTLFYTNSNKIVIHPMIIGPRDFTDVKKWLYDPYQLLINKSIKICNYNEDWVAVLNYRGLSESFLETIIVLIDQKRVSSISFSDDFIGRGMTELLDFKPQCIEYVFDEKIMIEDGLGLLFYLYFEMFIKVYRRFTLQKLCQTADFKEDLTLVLDYLNAYNRISTKLRSQIEKMIYLYSIYNTKEDYDYIISELRVLLFKERLAENTSLYLIEIHTKKNIEDLCQYKVDINNISNRYYDEISSRYFVN